MTDTTYKPGDESLSSTGRSRSSLYDKSVGQSGMDVEHMQQSASEMYEKGAQKVSDTYSKAKEYGFANPGKTILLTLGIGAGIGFLLGSSYRAPHHRPARYARPVVSALTDVAREMFR